MKGLAVGPSLILVAAISKERLRKRGHEAVLTY